MHCCNVTLQRTNHSHVTLQHTLQRTNYSHGNAQIIRFIWHCNAQSIRLQRTKHTCRTALQCTNYLCHAGTHKPFACVTYTGLKAQTECTFTFISRTHTVTHCNTLQHTATHCNTLQHTECTFIHMCIKATHCNTLQHTATQCTD